MYWRTTIAQAMKLVVKGSEAGVAENSLREEVARTARDINILRRHFRPLEVIGNVAPLLGLLGTVIGMTPLSISWKRPAADLPSPLPQMPEDVAQNLMTWTLPVYFRLN